MSHFLFTYFFFAGVCCETRICCRPQRSSLGGICWCPSKTCDVVRVRGQLWSLGLEKEPSCLVLTSFSCSSCRCPRRNRYSMCITSVFLMRAFSLNSSRIRGMKPGLSRPARRKCRYRARTCFCSLL
uniref:Secreted protein n=1 Tax=Seriola lalandi dorsalis TaxID=1841481 RepID=A0A3B4XSK9_SERLL